MTSPTGVTLLTALAALALSCLPPPTHSSPLHPYPPTLEQELDSLNPQSLPQDVFSEDRVVHNPRDPPPLPLSHVHKEALRDVLRDDQAVNENDSSSPKRRPPLRDTSDAQQTDIASPDVVAELSDDPPPSAAAAAAAAAVDDVIPFENVAGIAEELEPEVASPSPVLKETESKGKDEEEELQVLDGNGQETQTQELNPDGKDGQDSHLKGGKSPVSDAQGTLEQDVDLVSVGSHERQTRKDSGFKIQDSQEEELQSLQAKDDENDDDDEEEEEEEEGEKSDIPNDLSLLEIEDRIENQAVAQELDSMTQPGRKESYYTDDLYNGYDDDNDDDDDDETDYWRKVTEDENPHKSFPEEAIPHAGETSSLAKSRESSHPSFAWTLDDVEEMSRYDLDDVMAAEELEGWAGHEEVKRGEEEEEEEEVARFRPVRVIVLNETLYLNTTEDDHLPKFRPIPIPDKFEDYDVNKDGVISLPELRYVSRATEGARQAFRDADSDGDGWVDKTEFQRAGWGTPVEYAPPPPPPLFP